jgi:hypothetical protein
MGNLDFVLTFNQLADAKKCAEYLDQALARGLCASHDCHQFDDGPTLEFAIVVPVDELLLYLEILRTFNRKYIDDIGIRIQGCRTRLRDRIARWISPSPS